ncbi:MAG: carboxylesterase family protein [Lachnospiraceae bacterium]|nr:carboxylesterase family protein [Lachnospiraceae bacterium]
MALVETRTKYGRIRGLDQGSYTVFRGIPYAKPPVGELRFCAPKEPEVYEGLYEADHFRAACPQERHDPNSFYGKEFHLDPEFDAEQSEDCLYLNIWTPAKTQEEKLPVAFWIHGGAFLHGYSHEMEFDGKEYCRRGVILVTINYRVGALGFLAHPWLSAENEQGISGNYGILDQIAALSWVRNNITAFGGDPDNITIFGQSAGSMSVQTLVSSPLTKDWISKAILQSGGGYQNGFRVSIPLFEAEKTGEEFVKRCGVSDLEELRKIPAEELLEKQILMMQEYGTLFFTPNIDGVLLTDDLNRLLEQGGVKDIPYLIGSTKDDIGVSREDEKAGEYGSLYKGCIAWSEMQEQLGRKPSYVYYFTRDLQGDEAGAFHSSELWYMFGTLVRSWRPKSDGDYYLSVRMLDAWTNFMKTGDPNGEGVSGWRPCRREDPYVQILDTDRK